MFFAANFRANASPIPPDAPVINVAFIYFTSPGVNENLTEKIAAAIISQRSENSNKSGDCFCRIDQTRFASKENSNRENAFATGQTAEQNKLHDDRIVGINENIQNALPDPEKNERRRIIFFIPDEISDKNRGHDHLKKRTARNHHKFAEECETKDVRFRGSADQQCQENCRSAARMRSKENRSKAKLQK